MEEFAPAASTSRRGFLTFAGVGVGATALAPNAAADVGTTSPSGVVIENQTANVVFVDGAIKGIPYDSAGLNMAEYKARAASNTVAFNKAWKAAIALTRSVTSSTNANGSVLQNPNAGVIVRVDPGYYAIDQWDLTVARSDLGLANLEDATHGPYGEWTVNIAIEAEGVVLVAKDYGGSLYAGQPVVHLGSVERTGNSQNLLKKVKITGLKIQSDPNSQSNYASADRQGMLVEHCQNIHLSHMYISAFRRDGLIVQATMDSTFIDIDIMWCASLSKDATDATVAAYGLNIVTVGDNCNALRFIGMHLEFCNLTLKLDNGSRHIEFLGCKFEHGTWTTSRLAPHNLGQDPGTVPDARIREISFTGCSFVQNTYDNVNTMADGHPPHIQVADVVLSQRDVGLGKTAVSYVNCHFSTPDGVGERWFAGSAATFVACDFLGCGNSNKKNEKACFDLGDDVTLDCCRFTAARQVHSGGVLNDGGGTLGSVVDGSRSDLFRFHGASSRILNPVIYLPGEGDGLDSPSPGYLLTVAADSSSSTVRFNEFRGWHPGRYGTPSSRSGQVLNYEGDGGTRTQLTDRLIVEAFSGTSSGALSPDPQGSVSVVGHQNIRLAANNRYVQFVDAYAGQVIHLYADGVGVVLVNGNGLVLKGAQDLTLSPSKMAAFVFYVVSDSAYAWYEL